MTTAVALVMAKAPAPGRVKTRLGAGVGPAAAARLAAAALHDTMDACEAAFGADRCFLALDGDLGDAADGDALAARVRAWTVLPQRGEGFAARLAHAHREVAALSGAAVVQVGMDTPHASAADLRGVADLLALGPCAVLGPAADGGWWVLGLNRPELAGALETVTMSTARTGADTRAALVAAGATVATVATLRDVDDVADAAQVALVFPRTRFARCWAGVSAGETRP